MGGIVKYMIAKTQQAAQAPAEWVTQVGQVTGAVFAAEFGSVQVVPN